LIVDSRQSKNKNLNPGKEQAHKNRATPRVALLAFFVLLFFLLFLTINYQLATGN
jgi:hypothetical protein